MRRVTCDDSLVLAARRILDGDTAGYMRVARMRVAEAMRELREGSNHNVL